MSNFRRAFILLLTMFIATNVFAGAATCQGKFFNPVTDICWSCIFPLTIGKQEVMKMDQEGTQDLSDSNPLCGCLNPVRAGTYFLNSRFNWVVKHNGRFLFNRWRHEQEIVDTKTNAALTRYVDFSTSQERQKAGWNGWKFWLASRHCDDGGQNQDALRNFRNNFMGAEK